MNELFHIENLKLKLNSSRVTGSPQLCQSFRLGTIKQTDQKLSFLRRAVELERSCDLTRDSPDKPNED